MRSFSSVCILLAVAVFPVMTQQAVQTPSPMADNTRPHPRITQSEPVGRRVELKSLKGAKLFAGPRVNTNKPVPLVVHFHGVPWLIETHIAKSLPHAVLISVNLGSGSSVWSSVFGPGTFSGVDRRGESGIAAKTRMVFDHSDGFFRRVWSYSGDLATG